MAFVSINNLKLIQTFFKTEKFLLKLLFLNIQSSYFDTWMRWYSFKTYASKLLDIYLQSLKRNFNVLLHFIFRIISKYPIIFVTIEDLVWLSKKRVVYKGKTYNLDYLLNWTNRLSCLVMFKDGLNHTKSWIHDIKFKPFLFFNHYEVIWEIGSI